ncbi:MAG TPA: M20 family metallopeptidase [Acidimicrobiales bacterium]|nr:M20 family metallopeptidase [Acidimicrobiales bacterium]
MSRPELDLETAKRRVVEEVEGRAELLVDVSHRIHDRPELLFEEHHAAELLAGALESAGLEVERGAYGLKTAVAARAGGDGGAPRVAVLCEYDALPGIGHGCGHNVIAAAGLGAGLAAAAVSADAGGALLVLGTPAEEGGGGKAIMAGHGAFADVDAAMMVHPAGLDLTEPTAIAVASLRVEYEGRGAHAAADPEHGRNALDAAVLGYNAVAALRQHIRPTERVHGVFVEAGEKPNIVPHRAVAEWYVRSDTLATLQPLKERVLACLEAGASAAGCRMTCEPVAPEYSDLRTNRPLVELYRANSATLGRPLDEPAPGRRITASTDMGNVSHVVPSIHPMLAASPPEVSLHSEEFAAWAASPEADRAALDGAKAMAMTVVDLWLRPDALAEVRAAFDAAP